MSTVAINMFRADLLKIRKRTGTVVWALVLAVLPLAIFFIVKAVEHGSSAAEYPPAGGVQGFSDALRVLALFFGPLAAVLVGVEAGAGDLSAGVFRDLVVTGRSRLALFAARVPAALALTAIITLIGYAVVLIGTFALAGGLQTPDAAEVLNGLGFALLANAVVTALAVGFSSLVASKSAAIVALIAWELIASPLLASVESLGGSRKALFSQAIAHFSPVRTGDGPHGTDVTMGIGVALLVIAAWVLLVLALGAWRTNRIDA
jgi:ABC-type transport system involved in multi-copper enzyme maturation permease subunit